MHGLYICKYQNKNARVIDKINLKQGLVYLHLSAAIIKFRINKNDETCISHSE